MGNTDIQGALHQQDGELYLQIGETVNRDSPQKNGAIITKDEAPISEAEVYRLELDPTLCPIASHGEECVLGVRAKTLEKSVEFIEADRRFGLAIAKAWLSVWGEGPD